MATGYKITDKELKSLWFILAKDPFVRDENIEVIKNICRKNGIDDDSVSLFPPKNIDWSEVEDLLQTPSFFGERLIIIGDGDISDFSDEDIKKLSRLIQADNANRLAVALTYEDDKKIAAQKYKALFDTAKKSGLFFQVGLVDEKYLRDMIISHAKKQSTALSKELAAQIVDNTGNDVGLLVNEVDKYCAACGYTEITADIVNKVGVKTVEASVFEMIDLICRKKAAKAIEKLNNLFDLRTDEMAILGALTSGLVDMHRCKSARSKRISYSQVHKDFEKGGKPYRYQKAMSNAQSFSLEALDRIILLLLQADIAMKSTSADNRQILYVLVCQIIAKGNR